ncbi:DUF2024 family protein [Psychroserpens ponticola]|uniref:DUF2024 family protein n=1 Tax=Psychroserpens ponticola TaxID=2932268 RepID=A0ABY7RZP9_9FLAO|nr:DUF2024 family protein [Psychroserpens ponticola]WCO02562.1 DUF2024 family protein [Psychroserpens ponticola]
MKVSVWDTYVQRKDGKTMHFDILVPSNFKNETQIISFGNSYLSAKTFETKSLTADICNFCHIETAPESVVDDISKKGYSIIELKNCN